MAGASLQRFYRKLRKPAPLPWSQTGTNNGAIAPGGVAVAHGAYTNGGYTIPATYFQHGVPTVLMIHIGWAELTRLRRENGGNLIIAGHVGGNSMGFTPYLRALRERVLEVRTLGGVSGPEAKP